MINKIRYLLIFRVVFLIFRKFACLKSHIITNEASRTIQPET